MQSFPFCSLSLLFFFFPLSVPSLYVWALVSLLVISCFILLVYYYSHFVFRPASLVSSSGFSISCPPTCFLSPSLLSPSPLVRCHVLAHHCTFLVSFGDFSWLSSVLYFLFYPFELPTLKLSLSSFLPPESCISVCVPYSHFMTKVETAEIQESVFFWFSTIIKMTK